MSSKRTQSEASATDAAAGTDSSAVDGDDNVNVSSSSSLSGGGLPIGAEEGGASAKVARRSRSESYELFLGTYQAWQKQEEAAQDLIPVLGRLYKDKNVVAVIYHRRLNKKSHVDVMKVHQYVQETLGSNISLQDSLLICTAYSALAARSTQNTQFDIGVAYDRLRKAIGDCFQTSGNLRAHDDAMLQKVTQALKSFTSGDSPSSSPVSKSNDSATDVVLFGFGRIGRLLARLLVEKAGNGKKLMPRAIVVRRPAKEDGHLAKRMANLLMDTVHGPFNGIIKMDEQRNALIVNGIFIQVIYSGRNPEDIDYAAHGIRDAILIDNTGVFRNREGLSRHLKAKGISRVILTAPGQGDLPNIVAGVNCGIVSDTMDERILSAASCTTNAIVPVLDAIDSRFGISSGHLETVHSFTNDQNLVDNFHKKNRRGRSAPCNMVLTETGAGSAAGKALPQLKGKLTASAIRVPTPNVSMAVLILHLKTQTSAEEVNAVLRKISTTERAGQIGYSTSREVCSSDFVGHRSAGIVDAPRTKYMDQRVNLYVWYDNEFGYSCQVVRLLQKFAGIKHRVFPPAEN